MQPGGIIERDIGLATPILGWTRLAWAVVFVQVVAYAWLMFSNPAICFNVVDRFDWTYWRLFASAWTVIQIFFFTTLLANPIYLVLFWIALVLSGVAFVLYGAMALGLIYDYNNCLTDIVCSCFPIIPGSTGDPDWTIINLTVLLSLLCVLALLETLFVGVLLVNQQFRALLRSISFNSPQVMLQAGQPGATTPYVYAGLNNQALVASDADEAREAQHPAATTRRTRLVSRVRNSGLEIGHLQL